LACNRSASRGHDPDLGAGTDDECACDEDCDDDEPTAPASTEPPSPGWLRSGPPPGKKEVMDFCSVAAERFLASVGPAAVAAPFG
jgi:hypothetical protein